MRLSLARLPNSSRSWRPRSAALVALVLALALASLACTSVPPGATAVDAVSVEGTHQVSSGDVEDKIATTPSPKFLMLFRGIIYDYEIFDRYVFAKDLERVEAFYRSKGFYEAHARAGRVVYTTDNHVRVTVVVEEGPPTLVRDVILRGVEGLPPPIAKAVEAASVAKLRKGVRFDEDDYKSTDDAIKRALTDRGYAYAQTSRRAEIDLPGRYADVVYEVFPGPTAKFGEVTIDGLNRLPEAPVRRAIDIEPGAPYSTAAIDSAKQAVLDLGVFSDVTIDPELPNPPPNDAVVPLKVHVERSKIHQVTLGGGVEFDPIKTDVHLIAGWEDHNFLGGFRHLRTYVQPGLVLYPLRMQTPLDKPTNLLPEEKAHVELRQPGFIEARTGGLLQSEVNTYPILLTPQQGAPGQPVLGYFEYKGAVGVDRTFWKVYVSPTYNFQINSPFAYLGERDPTLSTIYLSYIDLMAHLDFRDDPLHPHQGLYLLNDLQLAGLGGTARDIRDQPDLRVYVPVYRKVTFGVRGSIGLLFPFNYDDPLDDPAAQTDRTRNNLESQILFFRGFYSGGPSSNRGYPLRGVGPHGAIPFFNPAIASQQLATSCVPGSPSYDPGRCALPMGGLTLWEINTELRIGISGPLEIATFCDSSDVSPREADIRTDSIRRLHLSCGAGLRYDTPVGPIRLDIGYRIPGLNPDFSDPNVVAQEGDPGSILGLPIAVDFGIGESF
jgi:outer membrane protein insertion porin family/translocation and assembly module TamA